MSSALSMIVVLCLGLLLTSTIGDASSQEGSFTRKRRSLMNLSSMVSDVTGRQSSDFISYGNYCGLGGSGIPVDPIDECCQIHDLCYNLSSKGVCHSLGEKGVYQVEYKWTRDKESLASCVQELQFFQDEDFHYENRVSLVGLFYLERFSFLVDQSVRFF
ncbi:phospholipase A(2) [Trichonephila clavipes]|nr:phospholipase A(2) [Trichonephila clavipes]